MAREAWSLSRLITTRSIRIPLSGPHATRREAAPGRRPAQRLTFFNEAYRALWPLDADWLASKPSDGELLDRLRELSRLPEVANYRDWKAKILAAYKSGRAWQGDLFGS